MLTYNLKYKPLEDKYTCTNILAKKGEKGRPSGGMVIGISTKQEGYTFSILSSSDFFIVIKFTVNSLHFIIIFFYLAPDASYFAKLRLLFQEVEDLFAQFDKVILMGDANAWTGNISTSHGVPRESADCRTNRRGLAFIQKAEEHGFIIGNGCTPGDSKGEITFTSSAGSRSGSSVVDLLLYTPTVTGATQSFRVLDLPHSSHFPILTNLIFQLNVPISQVIPKKKIILPKSQEKLNELKIELNVKLGELGCELGAGPLSNSVAEVILGVCKDHNLLKRPTQNNKPVWFDSECKELKFIKLQKLRRFRRVDAHKPDKRRDTLIDYLQVKKLYLDTCTKKREEHRRDAEEALCTAKSPSKFWKTVKLLRMKNASLPTSIDTQKWFKHFNNVFNPADQLHFPPSSATTNFAEDGILDREFNIFEVKLALKRLKNKKAAGPDKIPNEIWKYLKGKALENLMSLFQHVYEEGEIPLSWTKSTVTPIYKKGERDDPVNYRPISLLNTVLKIFTMILTSRFNEWLAKHNKISKFQAGFQKGRSTLDHIFVLKAAIHKQVRMKKQLYACFVDLKQAFDTPNHNLLWNCLAKEEVSDKFIRIFKSLYSRATTRISTGSGLTQEIPITKGVLQGESASPSLFNLFIEDLSRVLEQCGVEGIELTTLIIHHLLYADDLVILAPSKESLQVKINLTAEFFKSRGLVVNYSKTQVIVFKNSGRLSKKDKFNWDSTQISVVKQYTYLGIIFSSNGKFQVHLNYAISKGHAATAALHSILSFPKRFSIFALKKLLNSMLLATSTYAGAIWGANYTNELEIVQQRYLKKALGITRNAPKYFVRLETGVRQVKLQVAKLMYSFWVRIQSAESGSLIKCAFLDLKQAAENAHFRENENWAKQIHDLLNEVGMNSFWTWNNHYVSKSFKNKFIRTLSTILAMADVQAAKDSSTMLHYHELIKGHYGTKSYLLRDLPRYLTSAIAMIRLNRNQVLSRGKWTNLGEFKSVRCKFCGDNLSLSHLVYFCTRTNTIRERFRSSVKDLSPEYNTDLESLVEFIINKFCPLQVIKYFGQFISSCIQVYE